MILASSNIMQPTLSLYLSAPKSIFPMLNLIFHISYDHDYSELSISEAPLLLVLKNGHALVDCIERAEDIERSIQGNITL